MPSLAFRLKEVKFYDYNFNLLASPSKGSWQNTMFNYDFFVFNSRLKVPEFFDKLELITGKHGCPCKVFTQKHHFDPIMGYYTTTTMIMKDINDSAEKREFSGRVI